MNTLKDNQVQDPDYAIAGPSNQQKIYQETALINKTKRVNGVIEREFDKSIEEKEKEILLINDRLHEAIRTLSLLRYAIVSEFYNRKECQGASGSESKQSRIHPAIKQNIGKAPRTLRRRVGDNLPSTSDSAAASSAADDSNCLGNGWGDKSGVEMQTNGVGGKNHHDLGFNSQNLDSNLQKPGFSHQKINLNHQDFNQNHQVPGFSLKNHQDLTQNHQIPNGNPNNHQDIDQNHHHQQELNFNHQNLDQDHKILGLNNQDLGLNHQHYQESSLNHQIPSLNHQQYQGLSDSYQVPGLSHQFHQVPGQNHQELGQNHQMPGLKHQHHQVPGLNHQGKNINYQNLGLIHQNDQVPGLNHLESSIKYQDSALNHQNHQVLGLNHQATSIKLPNPGLSYKNHQVPGVNNTNHQLPGQHHQPPVHNHQASAPSHENQTLKRKIDHEHSNIRSKKSRLSLDSNTELEPQRGDVFKISKVLVIGNIASPIHPMDRQDDKYTHKWQVYVRGPIDDSIGEFVSKVVFHLHPSFKPNDLIEIDRPPFTLVRRGWGHFPIHISVFFKNKFNPPAYFVHNLTLDHVSEKVYAVKIYPTNYQPINYDSVNNFVNSDDENLLEPEDINVRDDINVSKNSNKPPNKPDKFKKIHSIYLEHNYINLNNIGENNKTIRHSPGKNTHPKNIYNNHGSIKNDKINRPVKNINGRVDNNENKNILISSGAVYEPLEIKIPDLHETMKNSVKQVLVFNDKQIPLNFNHKGETKKFKGNSNGVSILKKNNINGDINGRKNGINITIDPAKSLMLNVQDSEPALKLSTVGNSNFRGRVKAVDKKRKNINGRSVKLIEELKEIKGNDVEEIVKFLAKRLPIVTPEAGDAEYKKNYPYVCRTADEFLGFNVGKQRSAEWYRAKEIRSLLRYRVREEEIWTTKEILMWCRFNGYTVMRSREVSKSPGKGEREEDGSSCTEPKELVEWIQRMKETGMEKEEIEIVDVEGESLDVEVKVKEEKKDCCVKLEVEEDVARMNCFVYETARQVGVSIEDEEIEEGVSDCAAGRVVVKAVECLLEDLLRSSLSKAWERNNYKHCPDIITVNDIRKAISERDEFDIFTNSGLGTSTQ
ncbi:uncharacterized protein LOC130665349 [Microplitis mediator]|uniref:uncharacterized protein LOC130665349 n=1 Tax=Microplitis mediator TaxID=375433 RepID=UPI00255611E5|nr:uncharacterized protein LOC130665349 [Microplitis mediator]